MSSRAGDADSLLLKSLRSVVSGSDNTGYTSREFLRCVVTPRDLDHLEYWLQCEGAENPDRLLCEGKDTNNGVTALFLVCHARWVEGVEKLLTVGANPNLGKCVRSKEGDEEVWCTPLMEAVKVNDVLVMRVLIDHAAQVNYTVSHGVKTALEVAVTEGYPQCAKLLLENGARPKHTSTPDRRSSLRSPSMINVILSAVSAYGSCACEYCTMEVDHGPVCTCTEEMLENQKVWVEVVDLMLSAGFDVNEEECLAAASPLYWSIQYRNCRLLHMLILAGADVDFSSPRFGKTILQYAVEKNNSEAVRILIQNGANTNLSLLPEQSTKSTSHYARWISTLFGVALKSESYKTARYLELAGTQWCKFCRVQLVLFVRSKYEKFVHEGKDDIEDLRYLCSIAFQPKTLLELSRTRIRQSMLCLKPYKVQTLLVPLELHNYILCKDIT